jgi:GxxExxY protein
MEMVDLILKDEVYAVVGAAMEVQRVLGRGFLEGVYQDAMQLELNARGVPFEAEKPIDVEYKGQCLTHRYYADLVCFGQVIVELKALSRLSGNEEAQVLNYLKATDFKVGVLINFGRPGKLEWKRFANTLANL